MSHRTKITELTNGTVTSKKLYFWLGGTIVCERDGLQTGFPITKRFFSEGLIQGTTKLYYCTDHLGSVRELVDSTGAVRAEYRYSTYGEQTKQSGDLEADFGWAGLWNHKPSGLYLATYRAYDSANRRWISRDPLGEDVDLNLYSYCENNPIGSVDPDGLKPLPIKPRKKNPIEIRCSNKMPGGLNSAGTTIREDDHLVIYLHSSLKGKDKDVVLANEMKNAKDMLAAWERNRYPGWTAQEMLDSEIDSFLAEGQRAIQLGGRAGPYRPHDATLASGTNAIVNIIQNNPTLAGQRNAIRQMMDNGSFGSNYQSTSARARSDTTGYPIPFWPPP